MKNRFEIGELNPNIVAKSGEKIDPQRFSAYHVQQKLIEDYLTPNGFKSAPGPFRGVVIRVEEDGYSDFLGNFSGLQEVIKQPLARIKVRIPEIHSLPDPPVYGPEGEDSIISLYPTFVAIDCNVPKPAVGDIVYVDYGDRESLEDPRYFGVVFSRPVFGGTQTTTVNSEKKSSLFDKALGGLADFLAPPTSVNDIPNTKEYTPEDTPTCSDTFQTNFSSCTKDEAVAGEYDLYVGGQSVGKANMVVWTNKDKTKKLVLDKMQTILQKMSDDMKQQTGIDLKITSGYRPYDVQQCMYEKYLKCREEWIKAGRKGLGPSPVGSPDSSRQNSHLTGKAIDFQTGVSRQSTANKSRSQIDKEIKNGSFTKTWQWLLNNSQRYGFVWTGVSINEPWHFEFNENLAKASGFKV